MAVEFSEYRGKRKRSFRKRRFPLLRILLLVSLVSGAAALGLFQKVAEAISSRVNKPAAVVMTWETLCDSSGGVYAELKKGLHECVWNIGDTAVKLPTPMLRYVASMRNTGASRIRWVSKSENFTEGLLVKLEGDSMSHRYMQVVKNDSVRYWIDEENGCLFPGLCPRRPLGWAAVPISVNFDFEGQDSLLTKDVFCGESESPVYPVLSGVVLDVGRDSFGYFVEIDHGDNVMTRTSGLGFWSTPLSVGDSVYADVPVGRLMPQDSAMFFLTVRRNGLFVRWNDFYGYTHPVDSASIAIFKKRNGF
jgi:hypothetical protein